MEDFTRTQETLVIPVDPEHSALRLAVIGIFIVLGGIIFFTLNALIPSQGFNILALIASFIITALLTQQIEHLLKTRWPSGRTVRIAPDRVQIARRGRTEQEIITGQQVNVLSWRFEVRRRSRVPKGWYMVACALEQDDNYIPVYTFMSPQSFDQLNAGGHFTRLASQKELNANNGAQGNLRMAGEQRRLHTAENARWFTGAEMSSDDFQHYIRRLQEQFPQWMPAIL